MFTVICDDNSIIMLSFQNDNYEPFLKKYIGDYSFCGENALCRSCEAEILQYLDGKRKKFDLPLKLYGTDYQKKIWLALLKIPYGETTTYAGITAAAGAGIARSAGCALAHNPISVIVPCHRIICADGSLGGYCGGYQMTPIKKALLTLEGAKFNPSR